FFFFFFYKKKKKKKNNHFEKRSLDELLSLCLDMMEIDFGLSLGLSVFTLLVLLILALVFFKDILRFADFWFLQREFKTHMVVLVCYTAAYFATMLATVVPIGFAQTVLHKKEKQYMRKFELAFSIGVCFNHLAVVVLLFISGVSVVRWNKRAQKIVRQNTMKFEVNTQQKGHNEPHTVEIKQAKITELIRDKEGYEGWLYENKLNKYIYV
ncbi:hypothetical protein RFI_15859, partial [Reticulomyxa filosa]